MISEKGIKKVPQENPAEAKDDTSTIRGKCIFGNFVFLSQKEVP